MKTTGARAKRYALGSGEARNREQAVIQFLDTDTGNARAESISRLKGSMRASERRAAELEIAALRKKWR